MSAAGKAGPAGFTLIEMLVILAILTLITGLVFPAVDSALRGQDFAAAAVRLETALHGARADAIRAGRTTRVVALAGRRGWRYGDVTDRVPDGISIGLPDRGVTFFPDGSATGGDATIAGRAGSRRWQIRSVTGAIERVR